MPIPTAKPRCYELLDRKMRVLAMKYRVSLGYGGTVLGEWMAYAELLEEELARREAAEVRAAGGDVAILPRDR